jgi:hypothetical protein
MGTVRTIAVDLISRVTARTPGDFLTGDYIHQHGLSVQKLRVNIIHRANCSNKKEQLRLKRNPWNFLIPGALPL